MNQELNFIHKYKSTRIEGYSRVFLFLHGTGGNETAMDMIAESLDMNAATIAPRGQVLENGMPRFFKRLQPGVFDMEDLKYRTQEMIRFLKDAANTYNFDYEDIIVVGYSNGANIAASVLLTDPHIFRKAILFHPALPFKPESLPNMENHKILITAGHNDPHVPQEQTEKLAQLLTEAGANVRLYWHKDGHDLLIEEISAAKSFLEEIT